MQNTNLVGFPARTQIVDSKSGVPTSALSQWMTRLQQLINSLTGPTAMGNGAVANVQANAKGTGTGPTSLTVVQWREEIINGVTYYRPLFQ